MLNLRWSWHPPTVELLSSIDPAAWAASGGDPVAMLSSLRPGKLTELAADEDSLRRLHGGMDDPPGHTREPRSDQSAAGSARPRAGAGAPGCRCSCSPPTWRKTTPSCTR